MSIDLTNKITIPKVKQFSECSCLLACLESFFIDSGKSKTQKEMVAELPRHLCSEKGFVYQGKAMEVGKKLGIKMELIEFFPVKDNYDNTAILVLDVKPFRPSYATKSPDNFFHVVRYHKRISDSDFILMNPSAFFGLHLCSEEELKIVVKEAYYLSWIKQ